MIPLRIACIGKHGQTARAIAAAVAGYPSIELHQPGREGADLTRPDTLEALLHQSRAHIVINTAAYNFVDRAETEHEEAMRVNADGPRILARACRRLGVHLIHMSTDCVFDGEKDGAYVESDTPNPLSQYGRSKLAGELAIAAEYPEATTARVCWVFSEYGDNFVSKMIELARSRPSLNVVNDQVGPPTYAPDLAIALLRIARMKQEGANDLSGLLHLAAPDVMTRAEMALAIMAESRKQGAPAASIASVSTASFNAAAKRPLNARLSGARATRRLGLNWTPFGKALSKSVAGILARPN